MSVTATTLKALFALLGNRCAFPGCQQSLVDAQRSVVIGEVAHIRGRRPGAKRHDPLQTDGERDSFDNLLLLCPVHHTLIDASDQYDTATILSWKREKEATPAAPLVPSEGELNRLVHLLGHASAHAITINAPVGGDVHVVQSIGQSGGITAHTVIDQAPGPRLRQVRHSEVVMLDGMFESSTVYEIVAPYPPAALRLAAYAEGILSLDVRPQRDGLHLYGHTGRRDDHHFTTVQHPSGHYLVRVVLREKKPITIRYHFE